MFDKLNNFATMTAIMALAESGVERPARIERSPAELAYRGLLRDIRGRFLPTPYIAETSEPLTVAYAVVEELMQRGKHHDLIKTLKTIRAEAKIPPDELQKFWPSDKWLGFEDTMVGAIAVVLRDLRLNNSFLFEIEQGRLNPPSSEQP
ncbi:MAG: hypothetical protein HY431_01445 [Candidatus Levybacteria bacterium]|nr:hypothetical protein [Candidatus Levybacteria bacterium]